ncbi:MAG: serine hydrolase, partial [Lysobacterales bacterium]
PDTVFLIGSIVKDFTKMGILLLQDEGKLSVSDPIGNFFADVPGDKRNITIKQLLDHTSGIPDLIALDNSIIPEYFVDYDYIPVTRDQAITKTMNAPLLFEPGGDEVYSNSGYALLAAIIEIVSGETYEGYLNRRIFSPAGMMQTGYVLPDWSHSLLARGIDEGKDWGVPLDGNRWMTDGPSWNLRGNGGMLGTAPDLALWVRALKADNILPKAARNNFLENRKQSKNWNSLILASAGSNGIFNAVYVWMEDQKRNLVLISSNSEYNAELTYLHPMLGLVFEMSASAKENK